MNRILLVVSVLCLAACGLPRDRKGTLERVSGGELRAGVTHHPPEVDCTGATPRGDEVQMLERLATRLEARLTLHCTSEAALVDALREHALDIAAGAFDGKSPWLEKAGSTIPYDRDSGRLFLTAPGENHWLIRVDELIAAGSMTR